MADDTMDFEARLIDRVSSAMAKISNKFISQAKRMRSAMARVGNSLMSIKTFLAAGIGLVAFKKTVVAAGKFESQMREVATLSKDVSNNIKGYSEGILELSRKSGQSLETLTKGLYDSVSAGVDAGQALKFLESATQLAIGGATDTATAIDGMTTIMNAFSLEATDTAKITDSFFTAVKFGKTTVAELAAAIGPLAPTARAAGVSFQEMLGAISATTKAGFPTREAITAIQGALTGINTISPEAAAKMTKLGLAFKISAEDGVTFGDVMNNISKAAGGTLKGVLELIPNIRGAKGVLALAKDEGSDFAEVMKLMGNNAGATAEAYGKMTDTFEFKSNRVKQVFNTAFIEVGNQIMPLFENIANVIVANMDKIRATFGITGAVFNDVFNGWGMIINGLILSFHKIKVGVMEFGMAADKIGAKLGLLDEKTYDRVGRLKDLAEAQGNLAQATVDFNNSVAKDSSIASYLEDYNKNVSTAATSMKDLTTEQKKALEQAGMLTGSGASKGGKTSGGGKPNQEAVDAAKKTAAEIEMIFMDEQTQELTILKQTMEEKRKIMVEGGLEDVKKANDAEILLKQEILDKYKEMDAQRLAEAKALTESFKIMTLEGRDLERAELEMWYEEQKTMAEEKNADLLSLENAYEFKKSKLKETWDKKEQADAKRQTDFQKKLTQERINNYGQVSLMVLRTLSNTAEAMGASAGLQKKIAMAEAVIQGALATQKALASGVPPMSYVMASATAALAASNVAKISQQSFASGGFPMGRNAMIRVNERGQESVLNAGATNRLGVGNINALNSGQDVNRNITNQISYSPTIEINSNAPESIIDILREDKDEFAKFFEETVSRGFLSG